MLEESSILPVSWIEEKLRELNPGGVPGNRWQSGHKEEMLTTVRRWRAANPDKARAIRERSCAKPLTKSLAHARRNKRRAAEAGASGFHTLGEWELKKAQYKFRCAYCGSKGKLTEDHIIPLSKGGSNGIGNIVPACSMCNSLKWNKLDWVKNLQLALTG